MANDQAGPRVGQVIVLEGKAYKVEAIGRRFVTLTPVNVSKGNSRVRRYVELTELPAGPPDAA